MAKGVTMFKHILLPTDGSPVAMRAVAKGVELARSIGAELTVMTSLEHFPVGIMQSAYRPDGEQEEEPGHQLALNRLDQAEQLVKAAGLTCRRILVRDQPVYLGIIEAANTCGADLIVMGTRGLGLLDRWLIGSQTQRVLAHTTLPVMTLH